MALLIHTLLLKWGGGIRDIPSSNIDNFIDGTVTSIESNAIEVLQYCCFKFTSLISVSLPNATKIGTNSFNSCTALTSVYIPNVITINMYVFQKCNKLTSINLPKVTTILNSAFQECSKLSLMDCGNLKSIGPAAFYSCSSLTTFILRTTAIATLSNINAFAGTQIASGTGYIYVPDELVESYKVATNWSTYASQIKPLSEYKE